MVDEFQPYVGPRPFERTTVDQNRFFGREEEARELLSRISAHSAVLFYSQSGAGKTSLINAKLTPMLKAAGFEVLPASMRDVPAEDSVLKNVSNIHVFNVLRSWHEDATTHPGLTGISIPEYLKNRRRLIPDEVDGGRVTIFDQFEEIFTSYQERSSDRDGFFEQVSTALDDDRLLRVVFAMREEYIAELDSYLPWLPERLRTRYRLERLSTDDALLAIQSPLNNTKYSFADGVAKQLVKNLRLVPVETAKGVVKVLSDSVEPVQLQVVCKTLWDNCQKSWTTLRHDDKKVITQEYFETFGDVDQALSTFYEDAIECAVNAGVKEGVLRRWFEQSLITSAGTRGTVFRGRKETEGIPNAAVDELVNQHIIRGELRGGSRWYELTHDRFIAPIKASNERWFLKHSGGEQTPKRLEAKAEQWARDGRQRKDLIEDEGELLEAGRWLESTAAADVGYSETLLSFVQASRVANSEKKIRSARRFKLLTVALVVVVVLLGIATFFAIRGQLNAVESQQTAVAEALTATNLRQVAEDRQRVADEQAQQLRVRNQEVQDERDRANRERDRANRESALARKGENLAKQDRDMQIGLLLDTKSVDDDYNTAVIHSRSQCEMRNGLKKSLSEYERLSTAFEVARNVKQKAEIVKRIDEINKRLGILNNLSCP